MKCDVCLKEMTSPTGETVIGISLSLYSKANDIEYNDFLKKQFGKYELDRSYNVCGECWLKSLGIRPPKEKEMDETDDHT